MTAPAPFRKTRIGALLLLILLIGLCAPMMANTWRAHRLGSALAAMPLPEGSRVIARSTRVFHEGNGAGCDYQAVLVVAYYGAVEPLQAALTATLAARSTDPQARVITSASLGGTVFGAKLQGSFTEIALRPNADHAGLYLIDLSDTPHHASLDLRCM